MTQAVQNDWRAQLAEKAAGIPAPSGPIGTPVFTAPEAMSDYDRAQLGLRAGQPKGLVEGIKEGGLLQAVPFLNILAPLAGGFDRGQIQQDIDAINGGTASQEQFNRVVDWTIESQRPGSALYVAAQGIKQTIAFGGEIAATEGWYALGKAGVLKAFGKAAAKELLKETGEKGAQSILQQTLGAIGGVVTQQAAIGTAKAALSKVATGEWEGPDDVEAMRRALPEYEIDVDEGGKLQLLMRRTREAMGNEKYQARIFNFLQLGTERLGPTLAGIVSKVPVGKKILMLEEDFFKWMRGKGYSKTLDEALAKVGQKTQVHSLLEEWMEERSADVLAAAAPGLQEEWGDIKQTPEEAIGEALALGIPGGVRAIAGRVAGESEAKLKERVAKAGIVENRGEQGPPESSTIPLPQAEAEEAPVQPSAPVTPPGQEAAVVQKGLQTLSRRAGKDLKLEAAPEGPEAQAILERATARGIDVRWFSGSEEIDGLHAGEGVVLLNKDRLSDPGYATAVFGHESIHDIGAKDRELLDEVLGVVNATDPEGFAEAQTAAKAARPSMSEGLVPEEGLATYAQDRDALITYLGTDQGKGFLRGFYGKDKTAFRRFVDAVRRMLAKIGLADSPEDKALKRLSASLGYEVSVPSLRASDVVSQAFKVIEGARYQAPSVRTGEQAKQPPAEPRFSVSGWHGSPHRFEKFEAAKIGTGEGNQAFGYGLYFSDKQEIARTYREDNAGVDNRNIRSAKAFVKQRFLAEGGTEDKFQNFGIYDPRDWMRMAEEQGWTPPYPHPGGLYRVTLAPEDDEWLLWDEPLSKQSEKVKAALSQVGYGPAPGQFDALIRRFGERAAALGGNRASVERAVKTILTRDEMDEEAWGVVVREMDSRQQYADPQRLDPNVLHDVLYDTNPEQHGSSIYEDMARNEMPSDRDASAALLSAGIRGIKYKTGAARGSERAEYNYVVFDENDVTIEERFAIAPKKGTEGYKRMVARMSPELKNEDGSPKVLYHGTQRPDRISSIFRKDRATSGPMPMFTSAPQIASGYAEGKADTSLEVASYSEWFPVTINGKEMPLDKAWARLPGEVRSRLRRKLPHVTNIDVDGEEMEGYRLGSDDEYGLSGKDHWEWKVRDSKGNYLAAAVDMWLDSAALFNSEREFLDILRLGGMDMSLVDFQDPNEARSGVFPVYLIIANPLDTRNIPDSVYLRLEEGAETAPTPEFGPSVFLDPWDKRGRTPEAWIEALQEDRREGTSLAWTTIPDWVTQTLKGLGYDGIHDSGGKYGGADHDVWVPFEPSQVKSAIGNVGTYDPNNPDIRFASRRKQEEKKIKPGAAERAKEPPKLTRGQSIKLAVAKTAKSEERNLLPAAKNKIPEVDGSKSLIKVFQDWILQRLHAQEWARAQAAKTERELIAAIPRRTVGEALKEAVSAEPSRRRVREMDTAMHLYINLKNLAGTAQEKYEELKDSLSTYQRRIYELSQNLPPEVQAIADKIDAENDARGDYLLQAGVITGKVQHYSAIYWEQEGRQGTPGQTRFKQNTGRAKHRVYESILDGWANGERLRIAGAIGSQLEARIETSNVLHDRALIKLGLKAGILSTKSQEGWQQINHPNFWQKTQHVASGEEVETHARDISANEEGDIFRHRIPLYAPKPLAKKLNNVLDPSWFNDRKGWEALARWNAILKANILFSSFFHHQAYLRSYMFASPLHWDTAATVLNPVKGYRLGREAIDQWTPELQEGIQAGLTLYRDRDLNEAMLKEKTRIGKIIDRVPGARGAKSALVKLRDQQADFLFHRLGPHLKAAAFLLEYRHLLKKYQSKLEAGTVAKEDLAKIAADLANDDFGGLNLDFEGRSHTARQIARFLMLAPDWTESNVRTMLKALTGGIRGREYRTMWLRVGLRAGLATILFNALMAGFEDDDDPESKDFWERYQAAWEEGNLRVLELDITPIYRGLGGQDQKRKYFSILGHFRDPIKFIMHPGKSAKHKVSVLGGIGLEALEGSDWAGRPFTTYAELMGMDDKGQYKTSRRNRDGTWAYRRGEPKGGKMKGQTVSWRTESRKGAIGLEQLPSFMISQGNGLMPIQVQNMAAWLAGEMDGFDALTKSLGLMTATTHPKNEE